MVIGGSGSGKSTFARRLGTVTSLPVIHLDQLNWESGWVQKQGEVAAKLGREAAAQDRWIIEGNYSITFAERIARADTIIFLDFPALIRVWRVLLRMFKFRGQTRSDLAPDCPERIDLTFLPWVWSYSKRGGRARAFKILNDYKSQKRTICFNSNIAIDKFINEAIV